jgi:hypothetical protein
MNAAHERRQAHSGRIESEVIRVGDRIALLEKLKSEIAALRSGSPSES